MLYTKPDVSLNSFYAEPQAPDNPASFGELHEAYRQEAHRANEFFSGNYNEYDTYQEHIDRVQKLTGTQLDNPYNVFTFETGNDHLKHQREGGTLGWKEFQKQWRERQFRSKLAELAEKHPALKTQLLPEMSFQEQAYKKARDAEQNARETGERAPNSLTNWGAFITGSAQAMVEDPVNWITAPIGFSGAGLGAKGLAMAFLKNGAANAAVETGVQFLPGGVQDMRAESGLYSGLDYSAATIGGAFVLGGALDAGARGIRRGLGYGLGYQPVVRNGAISHWRKPGHPDLDDGLVKQAETGDTGAIRELTEQTELADNGVVRNTLDAMDADEALAQKPTIRTDRAVGGTEPRSRDILDDDHAAAVKQAIRSASDPDIEPPLVRVEETPRGPDMDFDQFVEYAKRLNADVDERIARSVDDAIASADQNTPIVIARAFREYPELVTDTVPFDDARFNVGRILSRLSDEAFERIEAGDVEPGYGRLIADHVADPADHVKVLDFLQQVDPPNEAAARMAIGEMIQSPEIRKPAPDTTPAIKLPEKQLDDPHGPEARQQVDELEAELAEELGLQSEGPGLDPSVITRDAGEVAAEFAARADEVRAAIDEAAGLLPEGVEVRIFDEIADLPSTIRAHVDVSHANRFAEAQKRFAEADSDEARLAARFEMNEAKAGRLVEALEDDGTIYLASWAMNPKGRIAHEAAHALVERGMMSPDEISLLAKVSRETGVFDPDMEARYRSDFEARRFGDRTSRVLDEEAAVHLLEAFAQGRRPALVTPEVHGLVQRIMDLIERIGNALRSRGFMSSVEADNSRLADIVDEFLSGEMAKRPEVQQWMRVNQTGERNIMHAFRALHASPHKFDRFDISKIGTGEGDYLPELVGEGGRGLYFTLSEDLHQRYLKNLAKKRAYSYDVRIDADEDELLDLDLPLDEQLPTIQDKLRQIGVVDDDDMLSIARHEEGVEQLKSVGIKGVSFSEFDGSAQPHLNVVVYDDALAQIVARNGKPVSDAPMYAMAHIHRSAEAKLMRETLEQFSRVISKGKRASVPPATVNRVHEAIDQVSHYVPQGVGTAAFKSARRLKASEINRAQPDINVVATYQKPDGSVVDIRLDHNTLFWSRAFYDRASNTIVVRKLGVEGDITAQVAGEVRHESVHAGWRTLPDDVKDRLASHAETLGVLDMEFGTMMSAIGQPAVRNETRLLPLREIYSARYQGRKDFDDVMRQEAVAHMVELREHGHYGDLEMAAIADDLVALENPKASLPMFAMRNIEQETTLYRGEPQNAKGGTGVHYTRSYERARGFAGPDGTVYQVKVPLNRMGELKPSRDKFNFVVPNDIREGRVEFDPGSGPMYAMRNPEGRARFGAKERAEQLKVDLAEIEAKMSGTDGDERAKLQAKRAALLNGKAQERILADIDAYRDQFGRSHRAKAFMFQIESYGEAAAQDLKHTREVIEDHAQSMMADALWQFRKGMITGDKRRSIGSVKKKLENMVRAAAGEQVDDSQATSMGHAWIKTAEYLRKRFNAAGGDIRKLAGWYAPQFHDGDALLKAGPDQWVSYLMQDGILDWDRMGVDVDNRRSFLQHAYETITSDGANTRADTDNLGRGALYKRHADHRVIHFKNADSWIAYNKIYGGGDIYAAMLGHISVMSRDIAMMERFGANPNVTFDRIANTLRNDALRARTASSLLDELDAELSRLKSGRSKVAEPLMKRMAEIHAELDKLRRKGRGRFPAGVGKIGKQIQTLHGELMDLHDQLRSIPLTAAGENMDRISAVLDQIESAEEFSATSRNPIESTEYYIKRAQEMMKAFKGDSNVPISSNLASAMSSTRNLIGAGILSGASISALTDQTISMAARAINGMPVRSQISSFLKGFTVQDRQLALEAGIGLDQVRVAWQEQARYLGNIDARGVTGFLADRTHAYSFLSPMTQAAKIGFSLDFMRFMVRMQSHQWNRLPAPARRMLERHGFSADDWGKIREITPTYKQASRMLTRDNISEALGEDMAERYAIMLARERSGGVLESTLRGRTLWVSDAQPGTLLGEITRSVAMLKSFPTSFSFLVLNRLWREMSSQGLTANTAGYATFLLLGGTILGGLVIQLKNIAHGRDPNDMTEGEFWYRAALQSGGMGIYGDFINSSSNRFGGGFGGTLLGPTGDFINAPLSMTVGSAIRYARDEPTNPGREFTNFARRYTPLLPFYTRLAYDRLVLDQLQEMIDPNYHQSFRAKVNNLRRSRGQSFYWPPGQSFGESRPPDLSQIAQ